MVFDRGVFPLYGHLRASPSLHLRKFDGTGGRAKWHFQTARASDVGEPTAEGGEIWLS